MKMKNLEGKSVVPKGSTAGMMGTVLGTTKGKVKEHKPEYIEVEWVNHLLDDKKTVKYTEKEFENSVMIYDG